MAKWWKALISFFLRTSRERLEFKPSRGTHWPAKNVVGGAFEAESQNPYQRCLDRLTLEGEMSTSLQTWW